MIGLNPAVKPLHVANLVTDNIRKTELEGSLLQLETSKSPKELEM